MTTTYDLTTDVGKVRLKIADTVIATAHFTDEEIQVFLDEADDDILLAAALALESWAAALTDNALSEKIGDYSYSKKQADNKMALAKQYREASGAGPATDWAELDLAAIGEYPIEEEE